MPLTAVYQMPEGSRICLPRGCVPALVGSVTSTMISFAPGFRYSVISKPNASNPPLWLPTTDPLTRTVVYQMPEGSRIFLPRGCVPVLVGSELGRAQV